MKWFEGSKTRSVLLGLIVGFPVVAALVPPATCYGSGGGQPIADAGLFRYAAQDPVVLDGTGSYDPDSSGPLSYAWRQIAGPPVVIIDANTATPTISGSIQTGTERGALPTISGFTQTSAIQECEFELIVSDGELISPPDMVKVIIVPDFGNNRLPELTSDSFDPDKPTVIVFRGGDCVIGFEVSAGDDRFRQLGWVNRANVIEFRAGYDPDSAAGPVTYYRCGDMIIVYLSSVAPNYNQTIQTLGASTGGMPAIDVGIHLNLTYEDPRYAVNRVSFFDVGCRTASGYSSCIDQFLVNSVDGEQCWVDNYESLAGEWLSLNGLSVYCPSFSHSDFRPWYTESLKSANSNQFNNGVVAGAYWSVVGPGKNLQLAPETGRTYTFQWHGSRYSGHMDFYDETNHPGRLPEPVTLWAWRDSSDPKGVVFTCKKSENAVGYELLLGPDPYRVMDYHVISDTPIPPCEVITNFPFEETWWTIRARDQHGSTIYADPMRVDLENLPWPTIENLTTGQTYRYIQAAIDHAAPGDEIVISPGTYQENIDFEGENLTVTSINPNDPNVVAATVINGVGQRPVVTFSRGQGAGCVLAGLTITGVTVGISCGDASPTIRNCTIESTGPIVIEFLYGYEPIIIDCTILGSIREVYDPRLVALWKMDETEGSIAYESVGDNDAFVIGNPLWLPDGGKVKGALEFDGIDDYISTDFVLNPADGAFSVFAWVRGGAPGQAVLSQTGGANWLCTDSLEGNLMTELKGTGRDASELLSQTIITDGNWHRIGLVWDGSYRTLYVDDVAVAEDTQTNLEGSENGLYVGVGRTFDAASFFSGLIDDVRIYNVALSAEEIEALAQ